MEKNTDETFNRLIRVRFIIPCKILTGAAIAFLVNPKPSPEVIKLIADCILYSLTVCSLHFIGDGVFYVVERIYRRLTNKEVKK